MAPYLSLPSYFQKSYLNRGSYPRNLIHRTVSTYPSALTAYRTRLDLAANDLFETNVNQLEVSIRDLQTDHGAGIDLDKLNVHTPAGLTKWFGVKVVQDPNDPQCPVVAVQQRDPKCRFVYIYSQHSRARLKITRGMLEELFTFHQVMPDYLDFITVFGLQSEPRDLNFSSFREEKNLKLQQHNSPVIDSLGRSSTYYQLCYNLKGVTRFDDPLEPEKRDHWIRQAAFYHRFDVVGGNTVWIVTKGGLDIQQRFKELTGSEARPEDKAFGTPVECFRSSLSAHLLFCHWSTEDWRGYLQWLEDTVERDTLMALLGPSGKGHNHRIYTARDIQRLQQWAEKVRQVITVLRGNMDVMASLQRFYLNLQTNQDFPQRDSCSDDIAVFATQLDNIISDFKRQIDRAEALVRITTNRTELVKQHRLERLNINLEREAIVVRIITIVTLVYLPATFVSTFFGTDVIKYQNSPSIEGTFSKVAMIRWIEVALPLTVLTFLLAYLGKNWAENRWQTAVLPMDTIERREGWVRGIWRRGYGERRGGEFGDEKA